MERLDAPRRSAVGQGEVSRCDEPGAAAAAREAAAVRRVATGAEVAAVGVWRDGIAEAPHKPFKLLRRPDRPRWQSGVYGLRSWHCSISLGYL